MKYIKLFEHTYSIYDLITMPMWKATELLIEQCKKIKPDMDLVRDLFEYAVLDVNWQDEEWDRTALMWASDYGHKEIVKMLLKRPEIDVNVQNEWGETALMKASLNGRTEIVKLLLERPEIRVNLRDKNGFTALTWSSNKGRTEIANLIRSHPNFNPDL